MPQIQLSRTTVKELAAVCRCYQRDDVRLVRRITVLSLLGHQVCVEVLSDDGAPPLLSLPPSVRPFCCGAWTALSMHGGGARS